MRSWWLSTLLICLLSLPQWGFALSTSDLQAQIATLMAQIQALQQQAAAQNAALVPTTNTSSRECPRIERTLLRGMQGSDVHALQVFLKSRGLLDAEPTGYFGALTERAVQAFQRNENIISSGTAHTTGWGAVGPKTRARIMSACSSTKVTTEVPAVCPAPATVKGQEPCLGVWEKITDSQNCHIGWKCRLSDVGQFGNKSPNIVHIDGPRELYVNQSGTWSIAAQDPESGSLEYGFIWGDEGTEDILSLLAGVSSMKFTSSPLFSHAFTVLGDYTPEVSVRDGAGNVTTGTLSVSVIARTASSSEDIPLPKTAAFGSCSYQGAVFDEGTETEGYSINDLCLATINTCQNRGVYIAQYVCDSGSWRLKLTNPFPTLPNYGNVVGTPCGSNGARKEVVVVPNTQICRGLLCATAQNYSKISLMCSYTNWVDWGVFTAGATTTTICSNPTPCEYGFGSDGRACAPKQNGVCQAAPMQNWPI